jgi:hypothetical protein
MYMRLLGYPASRISILTTYNGQRDLIECVAGCGKTWPLACTDARVRVWPLRC